MQHDLKRVHLAFTGVAVLQPAYRGPGQAVFEPLIAIMPESRRARVSEEVILDDGRVLGPRQIDAHHVFAVFPHAHLVRTPQTRDADYEYPTEREPEQGVCFFEREELIPWPPPLNTAVTYDDSPAGEDAVPTKASTGAGWIANWGKFAPGGNAHFYAGVIDEPGPFVRVRSERGGRISAGFVFEPPPKASFLYESVKPIYFAHETVVTLDYPGETEFFELRSRRFDTSDAREPLDLVFEWADTDEFKITFGNGSLVSLQGLLNGHFAGHDHAGPVDYEFQILRDVVSCEPDSLYHRLPVPYVTSREIVRVPCVASMLDTEGQYAVRSESSRDLFGDVRERRPSARSRRTEGANRYKR
jgi:hypothetical protein